VGGLLIATLANGLTLLQVSSYLQQTITGAIIVVAVLLDRGRSRA
jgi:ribose transport system permease protein